MHLLPLLLVLCVCTQAVLPPGAPTLRFGTLSAYCGLQEIYTVLEDTALEFATSFIRDRGGIVINGVPHNISWVRYNDASDTELTAILSERISTIDKVDVFFTGQGTYYPASYPALTTVPVVNVGDYLAWTNKYPNVWSFTPDGTLDSCMRMFGEIGGLRIAFIYEQQIETDYSVISIAKAQANGTSLDLAFEGILSPDLSNLAQILAEAMALDPAIDIVVGGGYGDESDALLTEIRRRDWKVKGIYFYLGPEQFKWRENIGRNGLHVFTPINWVAEDNYTDPWWGDSLKFAEAFRKATGTNATYIEAITIAGVQVTVAALERTTSLTLTDILAAFNLVNGTNTLIGPAEFKNPGQGIVPTNRCYQMNDKAGVYEVSATSPALVFPAYVDVLQDKGTNVKRWLGLGLGLGLGLLMIGLVVSAVLILKHFQVLFLPKVKSDEW